MFSTPAESTARVPEVMVDSVRSAPVTLKFDAVAASRLMPSVVSMATAPVAATTKVPL